MPDITWIVIGVTMVIDAATIALTFWGIRHNRITRQRWLADSEAKRAAFAASADATQRKFVHAMLPTQEGHWDIEYGFPGANGVTSAAQGVATMGRIIYTGEWYPITTTDDQTTIAEISAAQFWKEDQQ